MQNTNFFRTREALTQTDLLLLLSLICIVFLVYSNSYQGSFLYDDNALIVNNLALKSWRSVPSLFESFLTPGSAYYRPLQALLYLIVYQLFGLSVAPFHFLNIALHAANSCLMLLLGRRLGFNKTGVYAAAFIWALHPVNTEAVTYVSATADVLYAFFCLLGALAVLPDFSPRRIWFASLFFLLALLAKENALAFPLLAASLVYYVSEQRLNLRSYMRLWPLALVASVYTFAHLVLLIQATGSAVSAGTGPISPFASLRPLATLPIDLGLILWPANLYMKHNVASSSQMGEAWLIGGICFAGLSLFCVTKRQTIFSLPLSWAVLWFAGALAPVLCFGAGTVVYEHWLYLPTVGFILGISQMICAKSALRRPSFRLQRAAAGSMFFALLCILSVLTWRQNSIWHDPLTFYTHTIRLGDPEPEAHMNLGVDYARRSDYASALAQYDIAAAQFDRSTDLFSGNNRAALETDRAITVLDMPDFPGRENLAMNFLRKAVSIDPSYIPALSELTVLSKRGDTEPAAVDEHRSQTQH